MLSPGAVDGTPHSPPQVKIQKEVEEGRQHQEQCPIRDKPVRNPRDQDGDECGYPDGDLEVIFNLREHVRFLGRRQVLAHAVPLISVRGFIPTLPIVLRSLWAAISTAGVVLLIGKVCYGAPAVYKMAGAFSFRESQSASFTYCPNQ